MARRSVRGLAVTRYLEGLLFGLTPLDPLTFAATAILFLLMSAFACYFPARRAMAADPMVALRHDWVRTLKNQTGL
jgi:hypothetical protein